VPIGSPHAWLQTNGTGSPEVRHLGIDSWNAPGSTRSPWRSTTSNVDTIASTCRALGVDDRLDRVDLLDPDLRWLCHQFCAFLKADSTSAASSGSTGTVEK
jgi:hypothetical protein